MNKNEISYPTRIDWWIFFLIVGILLFLFGYGTHVVRAGQFLGWIHIGIGFILAVFIFMIGFPCRYTLTERSLRIAGGMLSREEIEYRRIKSAKPLYTFMNNSPSGSFHKVQIEFAADGFSDLRYISPRDREAFLAELNRRRESDG